MTDLILLTLTADRPEAIKLCAGYVSEMIKDYPGKCAWFVVDGGEEKIYNSCAGSVEEVFGASSTDLRYLPAEYYPDPKESFYHNLNCALEHIPANAVVAFIEDDDYYPPNYLRALAEFFEQDPTVEIVGESNAHHWHVPSMRWAIGITRGHCSLAQTMIQGEALTVLRRLAKKADTPYIDLDLWGRADLKRKILRSSNHSPLAVGMKGMPGRKGFVEAHDAGFYHLEDRTGGILKRWIGSAAAASYLGLSHLEDYSPLPARRNLLFHLVPRGSWKEHLRHLSFRQEIFTGQRIVMVAHDDSCAPIWEVKSELRKRGLFDLVLEADNDPELRETATFETLLRVLRSCAQPNSWTFYCHSKGIDTSSLPVNLWTHLMYAHCLGDKKKIIDALSTHPIAGCFKRYGEWPHFPKASRWHYSGTFFWFRNADVFSADWQGAITKSRYGVEAWPSLLFKNEEAVCLFGDRAGDLYRIAEVKHWVKKTETEF